MCDSIIYLKKLQVKPGELVVIKFDTNKYDLEKCQKIYQQIIKELPTGAHAIGIPISVELERTTIEEMIKQLEECKDGNGTMS